MLKILRRPIVIGFALAVLASSALAAFTFRVALVHHFGLARFFAWQTAPDRLETEWYTARLDGMHGWRVSSSDPAWRESDYDVKILAHRGLILHEVTLKMVEANAQGERPRTVVSIPLLDTASKSLNASQAFESQGAIRIPVKDLERGRRWITLTAHLRYPIGYANASDTAAPVAVDQIDHPEKFRIQLEAWRE